MKSREICGYDAGKWQASLIKRLGVHMDSSSVSQAVAALAKSSVTKLALVRLLARVGPFVLGESGKVAVAVAADFAVVGTVASVDPLVGDKRRLLDEALEAGLAGVATRVLDAMAALVGLEPFRYGKGVAADGALVEAFRSDDAILKGPLER